MLPATNGDFMSGYFCGITLVTTYVRGQRLTRGNLLIRVVRIFFSHSQ